MTTVPDRSTFETVYTGQPPLDFDRPQQTFLDMVDRITESVLDASWRTTATSGCCPATARECNCPPLRCDRK